MTGEKCRRVIRGRIQRSRKSNAEQFFHTAFNCHSEQRVFPRTNGIVVAG
jgi:hypothetical protein